VTEKAGLAHKVYLAAGQYPDSEIVSLVTAASAITGQEPFQIVEKFGEFIVPSLLKMYGHLLKPNWKSLDVIEHTEGTVHTVVRTSDKNALPPRLRTRRTAPDTVVLVYIHSERCAPGHGNWERARTSLQRNALRQPDSMHA